MGVIHKLSGVLVVFWCLSLCCSSRVFELSDKFSEIRKDSGHWLVKFYAPWCGHCKRLEPVWNHVAQALTKTNIRVGRVDCTRFTNIASHFAISIYPTIKLITRDEEFTFHGDRTKEDIVNFAIRMSGPAVQEITTPEMLNNMKHHKELFFMYVGDHEGPLWEAYNHTAKALQANAFFFSAKTDMAKQFVDIDELPAVFVYKESLHHFYSVESGSDAYEVQHLNESVYNWINEERFQTFPRITRGNFREILETKKYIVLALVEENKRLEIPEKHEEFRTKAETVIRQGRDKFHKNFQFGWTASADLAKSIAMKTMPVPCLLVLNSTTNHYYVPEIPAVNLTVAEIEIFLEEVYNQNVEAYGGNGFTVKLYRMYFETTTSLSDMWRGNPVLTTVIFGLPMGFFSLILYSVCCADILDAEEEEDEVLQHEKEE